MAPQLPKEVVAAIELAINTAHSQGKRPDLKAIAAIFNTTYESVRFINCRIRTINTTGTYVKKKPGPKALRGADQEEIERSVREVVASNVEMELKEVVRAVKERTGVELGTTTMSRFIKARGIPFIGGKGGPKGNGGRGRPGSKGRRKPGPEAESVERQQAGTISEGLGAENRTTYSSPYASTLSDQNAVDLLRIYGRPEQDYAAYGAYS
jgi:transposase